VHRLIAQDTVLFVHKGQGRALVDGRSMTVVPGTTIYAPKQVWHGLQNTGTGFLQVTWTVSPSGIEGFFRELSQLGAQPSATAIREIGHRYGVEFPAEGEVPQAQSVPAGGAPHRRRRDRGRGGRGGLKPSQAPQPAVEARDAVPVAGMPHAAAPSTAVPSGQPAAPGGRRRRHRGGRGRGRGQRQGGQSPQAVPQASAAPSGSAASPAPAAPGKPSSPRGRGRPQQSGGGAGRGGRRDRRGYRSRVKEVYMNGRWVQVSGEGPVISGDQPARRPPRRDDDEGPTGPLSVTL